MKAVHLGFRGIKSEKDTLTVLRMDGGLGLQSKIHAHVQAALKHAQLVVQPLKKEILRSSAPITVHQTVGAPGRMYPITVDPYR